MNEMAREREGLFFIPAIILKVYVYTSPLIIGRDNHVLMPDKLSNAVVCIMCRGTFLHQ